MSTDSNLLFGILALQADFINRDQFVEACAAWASRKAVPLAGLLVDRGWLSPADRETVERLLRNKLTKHGGDVRASLAEVAGPEVQRSLADVPDAAVRQAVSSSMTLVRTVAYTPESRDRYTVTRLHAQGGIGQVWLARDHDLGRDVALKDLRPEQSDNPKAAARFLEEAQITGQLEHPNIVPVYELASGPQDQRPYYTMRYVHGRTLTEAIKSFHGHRRDGKAEPMEFRELLNAFIGISHAVTFAHSRGVVHRDLKPQNVVLGDFGETVLLDWGLAKLVSRPEREAAPVVLDHPGGTDPTVQGQVLGTPAYMAPEQAEGRPDLIDARTDVYGLGAVLYEVLSGKQPFRGANTQEILDHVRKDDPEPPRRFWQGVPRALVAICKKAMAKRQADRYPTVAELSRDVQHWLGNEPVSVYAETFSERIGRWLRRYPALTAGTLTLLLAAVVALGVVLVLAEEYRKDVEAQRDKTQQSFHESISVMGQSLDILALQMDQAPVSGGQPFYKHLLQQTVERYERFPPEYHQQERLQLALASANFRLGKVSQDIGTLPEALTALTKSRDLYEAMPVPDNNPAAYRDQIARCHFSIGQTHLLLGDPGAAVESLRKAIALTDELFLAILQQESRWSEHPVASARPKTTGWNYRELLAWEYIYLAIAERRSGRVDDALRSFATARGHFDVLVREEFRSIDVSPYFPNGLGFCLLHEAQLEQDLGRAAQAGVKYQAALVQLRRAIDLQREKTKQNNKAIVQFQSVLALTLAHYATHLAEGNRPDEAAAAFDEAIALLAGQHRDNPALLNAQARLAIARASQGHFLVQTGKLAEAETAFRNAADVADRLANVPPPGLPDGARGNPEHMDGRGAAASALRGLGVVRHKQGRPAEALDALRKAVSVGAVVARHAPVHRADLAAAQAMLGRLVEDPNERRRLTAQALDSLRQAVQLGYRNASRIERDPAFEPLVTHPEFQQLLADLKK